MMATRRRILLMIFPDLVLGRAGAFWMKSGLAKGPIFDLTGETGGQHLWWKSILGYEDRFDTIFNMFYALQNILSLDF